DDRRGLSDYSPPSFGSSTCQLRGSRLVVNPTIRRRSCLGRHCRSYKVLPVTMRLRIVTGCQGRRQYPCKYAYYCRRQRQREIRWCEPLTSDRPDTSSAVWRINKSESLLRRSQFAHRI